MMQNQGNHYETGFSFLNACIKVPVRSVYLMKKASKPNQNQAKELGTLEPQNTG